MYFELTAPTKVAYARATMEAELLGLDPEASQEPLTFNIVTGSIEKVTHLREKHNLQLVHESDSEPTGYRRD
jgi:hypothetical protein